MIAVLAGSPAVLACPNCKDAIESGNGDGNDPLREARAYNNSIYFMLAVPYSILATGGVVCYRKMRVARTQSA